MRVFLVETMPQNKKTDPIDMPNDLPELSPQELEFLIGLEEGLDQSAAYKRGYGAEGYAKASLYVAASRKAHDPKIMAWREALQAQGFAKALLSREEHTRRLRALGARAAASGNYGAAVNAEVNAGKAEGHYVEKREDVTKPVADKMEQLKARNPQVAAMIQAMLDGDGVTKH